MTFEMIGILKSLIFIGMFFIASWICIPNAIKYWFLWKETRKQKNLSIAVVYALGAFFLLSGNFVVFIRAVGGCNV